MGIGSSAEDRTFPRAECCSGGVSIRAEGEGIDNGTSLRVAEKHIG